MKVSRILLGLILLANPLAALDVIEEDGGFRFALPAGFESRPSRNRELAPTTQFSIHFSRTSRCIIAPTGWSSLSVEAAIDATVALFVETFEAKAGDRTTEALTSASGVPVTRTVVQVEHAEIKRMVLLAFELPGNRVATYTITPGKLDDRTVDSLVDGMIRSLQLTP